LVGFAVVAALSARLRLHRPQHLPVVELLLHPLEIPGSVARHLVELLGHAGQSDLLARIGRRSRHFVVPTIAFQQLFAFLVLVIWTRGSNLAQWSLLQLWLRGQNGPRPRNN
jgi:hypothetical protein